MKSNTLEKFVLSTIILMGIIAFGYWVWHNPVQYFEESLPGKDNRPAKDTNSTEHIIIGEKFKEYNTTTSTLTGKWAHFRGTDFDNINKEKIKLIDHFGKEGPKILWKVILGEGHAAPAIYNGRVYLLDYDDRKKADALRCFSLETGVELWRRWYGVNVKRNHGMSRTMPAVTDKYVVTIGPRCHVMCSDTKTGDLIWGLDLSKAFNTEVPLWYTGQCPLIVNNEVIIAPGGTALLAGIDCASGKVLWKTPNTDGWKMSHSSVMPMTFDGKSMYVYFAIGGITGVSAEGADKGKVLWKSNAFNPSVIAPSPLILDNGRIFMTAGYGAGGALYQLSKNGENFSIKVVQMYKPLFGIASEQQTPIYWQKHIYAIQPKDAGTSRNQLVCCKADDCQTLLWTSSKTDRFGLGPYIMADGKIFILSDEAELTIAKVDNNGYTFLDKAKIMEGQDAWGPMAIADGYLLLRDSKTLVCLDVRMR